MTDPRLAAGIAAFNAGDFFAAHEAWEQLWLETVGNERVPLQGLVQIAAGYHKHEIGVSGGALKLLTRGLTNLSQYPNLLLGMNLDQARDAVNSDLGRLRVSLGAEHVSLSPPRLVFVR